MRESEALSAQLEELCMHTSVGSIFFSMRCQPHMRVGYDELLEAIFSLAQEIAGIGCDEPPNTPRKKIGHSELFWKTFGVARR